MLKQINKCQQTRMMTSDKLQDSTSMLINFQLQTYGLLH